MRFYSAILLLAVMVLNISKYQMPHIEYNLFKSYIAENLCVKRFDVNNCCQGNCYLEKQIQSISETEASPDNPGEEKKVQQQTDDFVLVNISAEIITCMNLQFTQLNDISILKIFLDIPAPPPKRFI